MLSGSQRESITIYIIYICIISVIHTVFHLWTFVITHKYKRIMLQGVNQNWFVSDLLWLSYHTMFLFTLTLRPSSQSLNRHSGWWSAQFSPRMPFLPQPIPLVRAWDRHRKSLHIQEGFGVPTWIPTQFSRVSRQIMMAVEIQSFSHYRLRLLPGDRAKD